MIRKLVALWLGALVGCGGGGSDLGPNPATVGRVTVNPDGLTLPVGGQGVFTAEVRDVNDAVVSNVVVSWSSEMPAIASVGSDGTVTGHVVGQTRVIAIAADKADSVDVLVVDQLTLEVDPPAATVAVGSTAQFSVIARNGAGQVVAAPSVTWASSAPGVGTIDAAGLATGVGGGQTSITASAGSVTSLPATLTVSDQAGACDGIGAVSSFDGSFDYDYVTSGDDQSGRRIEAQYHATLTSKLGHISTDPIFETWQGPLEGTGSVHETLTDPTTGDVDRFEADGAIVQSIGGVFKSVMQLIVNVTTCTYMLSVNPALHVTHFEFGTQREADEQVAAVIIGNATPLGAWKTLGSIGVPGYNIDAHTLVWSALHLNLDAFAPLGFANGLFADTDAVAGQATVSYLLIPK